MADTETKWQCSSGLSKQQELEIQRMVDGGVDEAPRPD